MLDLVPGLAVVATALIATFLPNLVLARTKHGRARASIAYILGFIAGLGATAVCAASVTTLGEDPGAVIAAGALAAFLGPFVGMAAAAWRRPPRRTSRARSEMARAA